MFLALPDSPITAKFLSKDERKLAVERLRADQTGIENKTLKPYQIVEAFRDYKTYFFFALATVANIPNGGISNFGIKPNVQVEYHYCPLNTLRRDTYHQGV